MPEIGTTVTRASVNEKEKKNNNEFMFWSIINMILSAASVLSDFSLGVL